MVSGMSNFIRHNLILLIPFFIGAMIGYKFGDRPPQTIEKVKTDTVTVFDTVYKEKPVPKLVYKDGTDTVTIETVQHDTVDAVIPIERKVYAEDSLYYASISGFRASLDTLIVYPKTTTITIDRTSYIQPKRWNFGITAGPSALVTPNGKIYGGVGITAGLTYRF